MNVKKRKNAVSPAVYMVGVAVLFLVLLSLEKEFQASETSFGDVMKQSLAQEFAESLEKRFVPVISFVQSMEREINPLLEHQISEMMPLYGYYRDVQATSLDETNYISLDDILRAEAVERSDEIQEDDRDEVTLQELIKAENEAALQNMEEMAAQEQMQETIAQQAVFVPNDIPYEVDLQALSDYETLVEKFYTIDKTTMAGSDQLNVSTLLGKDMTISKESEGPQILIYHTHSQEGFSDSVPGDAGTTIVGVGEHLSDILRSEYGYDVLHHTGQYDVEARDDAYANALPDIEEILEENPSIEVVIDLHRDSMPEETRLVMDLDGRPTARFMFFNGLSRTEKTGNIAYLYNENQEENLAFSFQLQLAATRYYPGVTRKIYLKGYRYNMHLRPRTALIELGAQNNTVEEAMNACDPLAHILDMVLSGES